MLNLAPDHLTTALRQLRLTLDLAEDLADRVTTPCRSEDRTRAFDELIHLSLRMKSFASLAHSLSASGAAPSAIYE